MDRWLDEKNKERSTVHQDRINASGTLDGSPTQLTRFLRELIAMTGQTADGVPVLELKLDDIVTRTTVQAADGNFLLISALLPKSRRAGYAPQSSEELSMRATQGIEYLWHAEAGRYIGVRKVPIANLPDERSVMDAILTTSDRAAAWFASRGAGKAER
jgi:hypothetical protein